jgi:DNA-binding XRE family transcriptional regulator
MACKQSVGHGSPATMASPSSDLARLAREDRTQGGAGIRRTALNVLAQLCYTTPVGSVFYSRGGCLVAEQVLPPLGRRLKELRTTAGMSQQSLAVAAGLSVSLVSQIERGSRSDPRISTTAALARALGVTLDQLVVGVAGSVLESGG